MGKTQRIGNCNSAVSGKVQTPETGIQSRLQCREVASKQTPKRGRCTKSAKGLRRFRECSSLVRIPNSRENMAPLRGCEGPGLPHIAV